MKSSNLKRHREQSTVKKPFEYFIRELDEELSAPPELESWQVDEMADILPTRGIVTTHEFETPMGFSDSIDQINGIFD